ncbi:MAG: hypothetical protein ACRD5Z_06380 [Bryobacteraceae bacterium]
MNPPSFLVELKRRNVYEFAVADAVHVWLLVPAASIVLRTFDVAALTPKASLIVLLRSERIFQGRWS